MGGKKGVVIMVKGEHCNAGERTRPSGFKGRINLVRAKEQQRSIYIILCVVCRPAIVKAEAEYVCKLIAGKCKY